MAKLFGTDGIRGIANEPPLDPWTLVAMGRALVASERTLGRAPRFLLARDTRLSGCMIEAAIMAGVCSEGGSTLLAGVLPTPAAARLAALRLHCPTVVVSASHNPWRDNGIKIFDEAGFKWDERREENFEQILANYLGAVGPHAATTDVGTCEQLSDAEDWYVQSLQDALGADQPLRGLRVVLDCANGATTRVGPMLLERCGATVCPIAVQPNGRNINEKCGALHPEEARKELLAGNAAVAVALDGDGDRVVFVDDTGEVLNGDHVLWILARYLQNTGTLKRPVVVGTIMSNWGLERALAEHGLHMLRAPVGDRHVVCWMREHGAQVGGEPSGHIVWLDHATTGDGMLTALAVLRIACEQGKSVRDLCAGLTLIPSVQKNVHVAAPTAALQARDVLRAVKAAEAALAGSGRVLVRPSGTEPVVRVLIEGHDLDRIHFWAEEIATVISKLGNPRGG